MKTTRLLIAMGVVAISYSWEKTAIFQKELIDWATNAINPIIPITLMTLQATIWGLEHELRKAT